MALGVAGYFALPREPGTVLLVLTPGFIVAFVAGQRWPVLTPFLAVLLASALGFNAAQLETRFSAAPMLAERLAPGSIEGLLYRAEPLPSGARLTIKNPRLGASEEKPLFLRIKVRTPFAQLPQAGEQIELRGPLWPPGEPVVPEGYSFRRHAFFKQIGASGFSFDAPRLLAPEKISFKDRLNVALEKIRRALILKTFALLPPDQAPMTAALLTGSQSGIAPDVMNAMRLSGLSHLLSISGIHVSMIALLIYVPLRALFALVPFLALRWPIKKIAAVAAIFGTSLYTLFVGADAPTVRSALMTGLVLFAVVADRKTTSVRLVMLAAALIMLAAPNHVMGPSFQMSFAAVLAMVAAYEKRLDAALKNDVSFELPFWLKALWRHGKDIILTSLIATAATTPFTLFHFQTFSFYGVVANMLAIPLTGLWVMPCLLLIYLATPFGLEDWFLKGAGWGVSGLIAIAREVAAWPFSQFFAPPMPTWALGLFILGGLWLCLWQKGLRFFGLLPILIACFYPLTVALPAVLIAPDGENWAVRLEDGRLAAYGKRKDNFVLYQWKQRTMNPEILFFNEKAPLSPGEDLSCEPEICSFRRGSFTALFLLKGATTETIRAACESRPDLLFAPFVLSDCGAPLMIDAKALRNFGAHTVTLTDKGPVVETARKEGEDRPWSVNISEPARPASPAP